MTASVRQWIYTIAAVASALIPVLVSLKALDPELGNGLLNLVAVLGGIGSGGAATAAVVLSRQRREGTLEFTGTAAEQAVEAIKATVSRAGEATAELQRILRVASELVPASPTSSTDPAAADYQP